MALIQCSFYSEVLHQETSLIVILPTPTMEDIMQNKKRTLKPDEKYQTLYLLHGLSENQTSWLRKTSIERYAHDKFLAIVMPPAGNSFYTNMVHGNNYWTFISEEVPSLVRSLFPLSDKREDNFAAGVSAGGYGAFKLALFKPECFGAVASLSGSADIRPLVTMAKKTGTMIKMIEECFGDLDQIIGGPNDLLAVLKEKSAQNTKLPKLYHCCGTEDMNYPIIKKFHEIALELGIDMTFEQDSGGHSWAYWDKSIQRVLDWLPSKNRT